MGTETNSIVFGQKTKEILNFMGDVENLNFILYFLIALLENLLNLSLLSFFLLNIREFFVFTVKGWRKFFFFFKESYFLLFNIINGK